MNKTWTKVVAIILAVLMAGSVCVAAVYAFSAGPETMSIAETGESNLRAVLFIAAAVAAAAVVVGVLLPKLKKK